MVLVVVVVLGVGVQVVDYVVFFVVVVVLVDDLVFLGNIVYIMFQVY